MDTPVPTPPPEPTSPAGSRSPGRKVTVGGFAGAVAAIACWMSDAYFGVKIPAEIAVSISAVITFGLQWIVPEAE